MPNHEIPIEDANLWDIIDWAVVEALSVNLGSNPQKDPIVAAVASKLIELGSQTGDADEKYFHKIFTRYVTAGTAAARRQMAAELAMLFGADPCRLIDYAAFKWGLFKRSSQPKP